MSPFLDVAKGAGRRCLIAGRVDQVVYAGILLGRPLLGCRITAGKSTATPKNENIRFLIMSARLGLPFGSFRQSL